MNLITKILAIVSIILMVIGGLSDWTKQTYFVSRKQYWYIGIYLLVLAILLEISHFEW